MLVPLSWLRDFAPFDLDPAALGEVFDNLGMVVEGIERVGEGLDGIVVAEVLEIRAIEGLDRVRMTVVDDGSGEPLEVACGAWNFEVGSRVPLAPVGTTLPNGMTIGRRKMRGVFSNGMLCSPDELGMGGGHDGLLVLNDLTDAPPGTPFTEAMGIVADVVYDLAIETNRPDALSIAGVARDAAAALGLPFTLAAGTGPEGDGPTTAELATIAVDAPDLCPRFTALAIRDVAIGPSSQLVQRRLTLAGMRPINNVVDASNYVMLELGQPTHPYDLDLLPGRGLSVRRAEAGETVTTLDGTIRIVGAGDDCLICDAEGAPVGIGGIMGGSSSEITEATTTVLLEAAYFTPMAIARTSKRLGLRTEASSRFERGTDPEGIERAVARFCEVLGTGRPAAGGLLGIRAIDPVRTAIRVRTARVNAILGTDLTDGDIVGLLGPIGFAATAAGPGLHDVVPPTFRPDATGEIDVIEEVARHHGYSRIARTVPRSLQAGGLTVRQHQRRVLRDALAGAGVSETICSPLIGPGDHERAGLAGPFIGAVDPLAREESILRASALPALLRAVAFNGSHRSPEVALFDIGSVFRPGSPGDPLPDEREVLSVALAGGDAPAAVRLLRLLLRVVQREDLVALEPAEVAGLHPTRTASVAVAGRAAGAVGEVDPDVLAAHGISGPVGWLELELDAVLPAARTWVQARPISRFPSSDIDLAFAVDEGIPAAAVEATLREAAGELLERVWLFDVYRGPGVPAGQRSLAYRLRFQAQDRTLTDEDVAAARTACIQAVESTHPAHLR